MSTALNQQRSTTLKLFEQLSKSKLRYAVLRNYEKFPDFSHDIDLVVHTEDLEDFRTLLIDLAREEQWDVLTECRHWNQSAAHHQNIEVFRFYNLSSLAYLQVDLFHSYLIYGHPWLSEHNLLEHSIYDERGFYKIDPTIENIYRLFQLYRNIQLKTPADKINRYQNMILDYANQERSLFSSELNRHFGPSATEALEKLALNDLKSFSKIMKIVKNRILLNHIAKPLECSYFWGARAIQLWNNYFHNPCGHILKFSIQKGQADYLFQTLDILQSHNIIIGWIASNAEHASLTWKERQILERGGLILKLAKQKVDAHITETTAPDKLQHHLLDFIINKHLVLYASQQYQTREQSSK